MSDVVPHIGQSVVAGQSQGLLEAVQRHVKLLRVEAAQTQVSEDLSVVDTHLEQSSGGVCGWVGVWMGGCVDGGVCGWV